MTSFFTAGSALRRLAKYTNSSSSSLPFYNAALIATATTTSIAISSSIEESHYQNGSSSSFWNKLTTTSCLVDDERNHSNSNHDDKNNIHTTKKSPVNIRTRMTSVGRFSLDSQTIENPSIPTVFMALSGSTPLSKTEFTKLWKERQMVDRHPRFHSRVSQTHPGYFESIVLPEEQDPVDQHVKETMFPSLVYRKELMHRIEQCLIQPIHVWQQLWDIQLSSGPLGQSGAISKQKTKDILQNQNQDKDNGGSTPRSTITSSSSFFSPKQQNQKPMESILLFRSHHAMADGVSLIAALSDLCDEAEELRQEVAQELERRRGKNKNTSIFLIRWLQQLVKLLQICIWLCFGSIQAIGHQIMISISSSNPFEKIRAIQEQQQVSNDTTTTMTDQERFGRTISWCDAAPVDEIKVITRAIGGRVTLNDVMVSCVSYAVAKQIEYHRTKLMEQQQQQQDGNDDNGTTSNETKNALPIQKSINVAIPVHLGGGVILPGKSIGNNIGAFVAKIPGEMQNTDSSSESTAAATTTAIDRLQRVHKSLYYCKRSPAPLISHYGAKFCSTLLPTSVTQRLFANANGGACVAVSNSRGSSKKLHLGGRTIESSAGFLPLPPGINIGIIVQTYAGTCSLSVTAERYAVPDADQFLQWMLEEYQELYDQAQEINNNKNINKNVAKNKKET